MMARQLMCDICKKPTDRIEAKLHYIAVGSGKRITHSDYTHHADVGACCANRILELFNFRSRMTRKEYNAERKGLKVVK
jgi:hypothetical protein